MKQNLILTITSLLSILFSMFHLADDLNRGMFPLGLASLPAVVVLALWLFATLVLVERRSGQVIVLVMSLLVMGLPIIHMRARAGITGGVTPGSAGGFFFACTLLALGVTAIVSVLLSARGLWRLRRDRASRTVQTPFSKASPQ